LERPQLSFVPEFQGPIEGWVVNFLKRNYWKVAPLYDWDDLFQEAYLKFLVVSEKYPEVVDPPHFMALFKTSFIRRFIDLSKKKMLDPTILEADLFPIDGEPGTLEMNSPTYEDDCFVCMMMHYAPIEIKILIEAFDDPKIRAKFQTKFLTVRTGNKKGRKETTNERICRILGIAPGTQVRQMFYQHLGLDISPGRISN